MKVICPNCGLEDEGNFCSNCGQALPIPEVEELNEDIQPNIVIPDVPWTDKCPACKVGALHQVIEKKLFGGTKPTENYKCHFCAAFFLKFGNKYRLTGIKDKKLDVWKEYGKEELKPEEWKRIAYGGISDAKQKENDIVSILNDVKQGRLRPDIEFADIESPILLKRAEEVKIVLVNMTLWQARSVTHTYGGYGGPSFRIAPGVYWRMGSFGARSESHDELRAIDKGILTFTDKRLVFTGTKRSTDINLNKITAIEPYTDGIAIHVTGRSKVLCFSGITPGRYRMQLKWHNHTYEEFFNGAWLSAMIEYYAMIQNQ